MRPKIWYIHESSLTSNLRSKTVSGFMLKSPLDVRKTRAKLMHRAHLFFANFTWKMEKLRDLATFTNKLS